MQPIRNKFNDQWILDLTILSIMLLIGYLFYLGHYPLFTPDEGRYSEVAREMVLTGDYITPKVNGIPFLDKPILYYWFQALAIHLFGLKEFALRLFPALFAVAGGLFTYSCGRLLFNRRTGIIAAIVLTTTPLYFGAGHYANLDLEVAVLISAAQMCYLIGFMKEKRKFIMLGWILAAFAFLTKGIIGILFPILTVTLWLLALGNVKDLKKLQFGRGVILFTLIVLPWHILVQQANPQFLYYFFVTQQLTRFISTATFNNQSPIWFYVPIIVIGFLPWVGFSFFAIREAIKKIFHDRRNYPIELFLLIWMATIFIFFSIPHSKIITYILPLFPALALLTGHYISTLLNQQITLPKLFIAHGLLFLVASIGLALCVYGHVFRIPPTLNPYIYGMASVLFIAGLSSFAIIKFHSVLYQFYLNTGASIFILLIALISAVHFNTNTVKPLAVELKKIIKPQDEIITYFTFYQDLPVYLTHRVTIVADWREENALKNDNWLRELTPGKSFLKNTDWLINEEQFWQRYNSEKRIFVFLNQNYFAQFKQKATRYFYLGQFHRIILLSNQPNLITAEMRKRFLELSQIDHPKVVHQSLFLFE